MVAHQPWGTPEYTVAYYWREYSLALIWPLHVPEWIDDQTIENKLCECVQTNRLPWELE